MKILSFNIRGLGGGPKKIALKNIVPELETRHLIDSRDYVFR
jgi:hypothetical protein